jgi:small subunit ribosomal protein S24e
MKLTITNKTQNALTDRVEVDGQLVFEGSTPSNSDVTATLAAEIKADVELVVVKNIYTIYSEQKANFKAYVYSSKEAKQKVEVVTKHLKKKAEESAKKAKEEADSKKEADAKEAEKPAEETVAEPVKEEAAKEEAPVAEAPAVEVPAPEAKEE